MTARPPPAMRSYQRTLGIDYSGAETPTSSLRGLRVYAAEGDDEAIEVLPPPSPRKYWTRRGLAEWLMSQLEDGPPTIVGIDHAFSFPLRCFEVHELPLNWPLFLEDFQRHWPTDEDNVYVDFVIDGLAGNCAARMGQRRWRRFTEGRARGAKSVFHFNVQGHVAKSTNAGIPWLRFLRQRLGATVHFWPFDGWTPPLGRSTVVEVYPSLWRHAYPVNGRSGDQHDAYTVAMWLQRADPDGSLKSALQPALSVTERQAAEVEGWILGVG